MPKRKRSEAGLPVLLRPIPKGRPVEPAALAEVRGSLDGAPRTAEHLIEHLHRLQDRFGHLSAAHLVALAEELRLTPAEVYEVATFYHHFDVVKEGDRVPAALTIRVCDSVACAMAGSGALLEKLRERLGDRVRVVRASCIGQCDGAPAVLVGRNPVRGGDAAAIQAHVDGDHVEPELPDYRDFAAYRAGGGYASLEACYARSADRATAAEAVERITAEAEASGLRGLGGAGFPSARKWGFVRAEPEPRYLVVNADEGEPGTFKDRFCLETDPHRVLEGALAAAAAVSASAIYIYLRDEYAAARAILEREIPRLAGLEDWRLPPIHLHRGAGAYICGEETALIESLEGKRGEPRLRPPFPAQFGVFGRPTLVHNVETLYWLTEIMREGGAAWVATGKKGHAGRRLYSVSGRVARPGLYEASAGITARELIERAGGMAEGHTFRGFLPGGASGGILPASLGDVPLDFGSLDAHSAFIGSAAVVIFSEADSARGIALNLLRFFAHESCGRCTPCRVGTAKAVGIMEAGAGDGDRLADLATVLADASICGLGQAAANPIRSLLRFFPEELDT